MKHLGRHIVNGAVAGVALLSLLSGCSHPNVITNELPKDTSLRRLVRGKNIVLLVQPMAAPEQGGYWQGYGDQQGGAPPSEGEYEGGRGNRGGVNRRGEMMNNLILDACDSELVADSASVPQRLTDSASAATMLAGNCGGYQADYAVLVNGQELNFQSQRRGGAGGGRRRGGGFPGGGGGYPGGGYPGGGGMDDINGVTDEMEPPGAFSQVYQRGDDESGERRGPSGTVKFYITVFRLSDCKRIYIAQAETDSFSPSDRENGVKEIRSAVKKLFEIEGDE